jgi:formylglycine-generating enzyme required for sulfatase activity
MCYRFFIQISLSLIAAGFSCAGTDGRPEQPVPAGMVLIPAGQFKPPIGAQQTSNAIPIEAFFLDAMPVTNSDFLEFVRANPRWRRSQIRRVAADENYLKLWSGDLEIGPESLTNAPVTYVSWYAAKAYSFWKGKRLPTADEWEYAAAASPCRIDGENDPKFMRELLAWYSSPSPEKLPATGQGEPNFFEVYDLHGLVWEWVEDINAPWVRMNGRGGGEQTSEAFCGGGSQGAKDPGNFPAFMRYGFRSSLQINYTVHNLGFRCAREVKSDSR